MSLIFLASPFVKEEPTVGLAVWLQGTDKSTKGLVECRVTQPGLRKLGAKGITNEELLRVFNEHRQRIESVSESKFDLGKLEIMPDSVVVWIGPNDL